MVFENIDKDYQQKEIEVVVEFTLVPEYNKSVETLISMVNIWGMRLDYSNSLDSKAIVFMTLSTFKNLYKKKPVIGYKYDLPKASSFILSSKVTDINI